MRVENGIRNEYLAEQSKPEDKPINETSSKIKERMKNFDVEVTYKVNYFTPLSAQWYYPNYFGFTVIPVWCRQEKLTTAPM